MRKGLGEGRKCLSIARHSDLAVCIKITCGHLKSKAEDKTLCQDCQNKMIRKGQGLYFRGCNYKR